MAEPSIAIIPSGYKAEKIYSVLPTNGNADLDFARNSKATRINEQGLIEEMAVNVPILDYSDGTCPSLKLQPQSTNLITYSESFDNSYWVKSGATVTSGFSAPSVDSPLGAFKLVFDGSGRNFYTSFASTSGTSSGVYVKGTYGETIQFGVAGGDSLFTLSGEWQRLESYLATSATIFTLNTYGGATARELYIFGAQLEEQSYATSYIKTEGSTQTRLADTASKSGLENEINSSEGVLYAEISALSNDGTFRNVGISDETSANSVRMYFRNTANKITVLIGSSAGSGASVTVNIADVLAFNKIAVRYKVNDVSVFVNGSLGATISSVTMPIGLSELSLDIGGQLPFYGNCKDLRVYKTILTDEELTCLTTI